jgi:hypothetical protein
MGVLNTSSFAGAGQTSVIDQELRFGRSTFHCGAPLQLL